MELISWFSSDMCMLSVRLNHPTDPNKVYMGSHNALELVVYILYALRYISVTSIDDNHSILHAITIIFHEKGFWINNPTCTIHPKKIAVYPRT